MLKQNHQLPHLAELLRKQNPNYVSRLIYFQGAGLEEVSMCGSWPLQSNDTFFCIVTANNQRIKMSEHSVISWLIGRANLLVRLVIRKCKIESFETNFIRLQIEFTVMPTITKEETLLIQSSPRILCCLGKCHFWSWSLYTPLWLGSHFKLKMWNSHLIRISLQVAVYWPYCNGSLV